MKKTLIIFTWIMAIVSVGGVVFANTAEEFLIQGQEYYNQGDFNKAIEVLEKGVEFDPNSASLYNALGLAHGALNDSIEDVAWFFKVAVDIDPNYAEAYGNMCRAYYQATEYDLAQSACEEALRINPEYGPAQLSMGWTYLMGHSNPSEALRYFEAVRKKVSAPMVYVGMGLAYSKLGDNPRVLEMITTLREMGANDYASQLEAGIRKQQEAPPPATTFQRPPPAPGGATTVVPSQGGTGTLSTDLGTGPVSGQMKIRLKGKMENTAVPPKETPSKAHPGSLSGD